MQGVFGKALQIAGFPSGFRVDCCESTAGGSGRADSADTVDEGNARGRGEP